MCEPLTIYSIVPFIYLFIWVSEIYALHRVVKCSKMEKKWWFISVWNLGLKYRVSYYLWSSEGFNKGEKSESNFNHTFVHNVYFSLSKKLLLFFIIRKNITKLIFNCQNVWYDIKICWLRSFFVTYCSKNDCFQVKRLKLSSLLL